MITTQKIIDSLAAFSGQKGYGGKQSTTLISPAFPTSFNLSGSHYDVNRVANYERKLEQDEKWFMLDRTLRHTDIEKVGEAQHLSFFEMFTTVVGAPSERASKKNIINENFEILNDVLALDINRIFVTIFGGGYVKNKQYRKDEEAFSLWKQAGIPENNLVWVPGHKNFVYLTEDGEQAGPRCEIYFNFTAQDAQPRFLEIGTAVFETHKFSSRAGGLIPLENYVFGNAFGVERLVMATNGFSGIDEVDTILPLKEIVVRHLSHGKLADIFVSDVQIITDHVRAILFAIMDGQKLDNSRRGTILKKMIRTLTTQVKLLYIDQESQLYRELVAKICEMFAMRYPKLQTVQLETLDILEASRRKGIYKPDSTHIGKE